MKTKDNSFSALVEALNARFSETYLPFGVLEDQVTLKEEGPDTPVEEEAEDKS